MVFSDFANRLYSQIGAGSSKYAFTKSIFEAILSDEWQDITDEYSQETYKSYFYGRTHITKIAQKITAYIEPFNFINYINKNFSDSARESLVKAFEDVLPDANPYNIGEQLADLFATIIREAAAKKRKTASKYASAQGKQMHDKSKKVTFPSDVLFAEKHSSTIKHIMSDSDSEDDEETADTCEPINVEANPDRDVKIQIINNPTIVNQNGEKNVHIEHLDVLNL